ncbi:MAG: MFS transporter [Bacillaceae bacterium]|nr:MFS transporter [Bacillaceae bacterium]
MEHLNHRMKLLIMIAIMSAMFFAAVNMTIVGTVLPKIVAALGGMDYFSWVFTIYMLTSSVTAILVGRLSDIYGRKPFILTGIAIFMTGTFVSGLSQNMMQLILFRALQGIGGGMIMSTSFTAVGDLFPPRERGRWQGLMGSAFGVASVLGPVLGGYIVDNLEWRWVFWVFLPFGAIAFVLISRFFPAMEKKETGERVDFPGSVLLTLCLIPILLAFSWGGSSYAWVSPQIMGLFLGALVSLILFILVEKRAQSPVLPLSLFQNSIFTLSNLINFLTGMGMFGAIMFIPFFVQGVIGVSATQSGLITMPMTVSMVITSAIVGQIMTRTGKYKKVGILGMAIMAGGMYLLTTMDMETGSFTVVVYMIIMGMGLGSSFPVFTLTVQNGVSHRFIGVATSSVQLFRQLGGTVGVSLMGTLMSSRMGEEIRSRLAGMQEMDPQLMENMEAIQNPQVLMDPDKIAAAQAQVPPEMAAVFEKVVLVMKESLSVAIAHTFSFGLILLLLAVVASLFLKEIPLRLSNQEEPETGDKTQQQTNNGQSGGTSPLGERG